MKFFNILFVSALALNGCAVYTINLPVADSSEEHQSRSAERARQRREAPRMTLAVANFPTPPHSVEAEQSLIGAVLLDPK